VTGSAGGPGPPLVLIAEDERPIAAILRAVVADAGYEPAVATHGRQALELARERWPALVITDLMMPYLGGDELIAALRTEAEARGRGAASHPDDCSRPSPGAPGRSRRRAAQALRPR